MKTENLHKCICNTRSILEMENKDLKAQLKRVTEFIEELNFEKSPHAELLIRLSKQLLQDA